MANYTTIYDSRRFVRSDSTDTTVLLPVAAGGSAADLSATGGAKNYVKQAGVGSAFTVGTIPASDIASGAALTKADDTNVTMTLGGTPSTALLAAASLTLGWTGTLGLARGGTNANLSATGGTNNVLKQASAGAAITVGTLASTNLSDVVAWTAVTYASGNFTASSGTWTVDSGDQLTYSYTVIGKSMTVAFVIDASSVSATPISLQIAIPGGYSAARNMQTTMWRQDNGGTFALGQVRVAASGTVINLEKDPVGTTWSVATNNTGMRGQITFEVT